MSKLNLNDVKLLNFLSSIKDLIKFGDDYKLIKKNLNLAFQNSKTSNLTDNFLNNENNGFLLWLNNEIILIKKLKAALYWELILNNKKSELLFSDNKIFEKEKFKQFYLQNCN
ncbi:MAG: hypothetical protein AM1032_000027 [Mycoplasmataceae bacterium]|nr:MAG: hypothetical protein AM1032_000027 [Mycoplasmataceae bacterium]